MSETAALRSARFRAAREREWDELDRMVEVALARGLMALPDEDLERLPMLYRGVVASLEVARKTTMDRALVAYLEALASRAYLAIYASRRSERGVLLRFLGVTFPKRVRSMGRELGLSTFVFALGVVVAWILVARDPSWYFAFVDGGMAGDRAPGATTEALRSTLYSRGDGDLDVFTSYLFTHNAGIGLTAFALGFAAGVPTALLVFTNGLVLGAFFALFASHGLLPNLLGWILPHGIPEILAVLLCGAAGLHIGRALVSPGDRSTRDALVRAGRRASTVVTGAVLLFAIAGVIEGVFRQLVTGDLQRFALASFDVVFLTAWIGFGGFTSEDVDADDD